MRVWRIAPRARSAFDGEGSRRVGGRWNEKGIPVVYSSATIALAAWECFVNVDLENAPADLVARPADVPDELSIKIIEISELPRNWRDYPAPEELALIGSRWARSLETPVLAVPSAVVPQETNYLLNPRHPDFSKILIGEPEPFPLDPRIRK